MWGAGLRGGWKAEICKGRYMRSLCRFWGKSCLGVSYSFSMSAKRFLSRCSGFLRQGFHMGRNRPLEMYAIWVGRWSRLSTFPVCKRRT